MTRTLRSLLCAASAAVSSLTAHAQDPQFSQFYANPIYHNPAFAGGSGAGRLIANYRMQWPALDARYRTAAFSFDTYDEDTRVGLGVQAISDWQSTVFQTTQLSGIGSWMLPIMQDNDREARVVFGLQASYIGSRFDPAGMTFADQYAVGGLVNVVSADPLAMGGALSKHSADFSGGILFEHDLGDDKAKYWAGLAVHHIYRSQLRGDWLGQRISGMAGLRIPFTGGRGLWNKGLVHQQNRDRSVSLTTHLRQQGNNLQLDTGFNLTYSPLMVGVWYRGIPIRRLDKTFQNDALIGIVGFQFDRFLVEYSYDITVSPLRFATGGAHELSIWYGLDSLFQFSSTKNRSARRQRRCQHF
ncbi:PorP/SprF family type IX secretion system membrane protein [Spirosoma montaniterrae]|uniref:Type IX secretion system membrane protein PorP/SprF n=1 Tax=Spirosoma montaniterrae TaxID=1178516 RepID=A0A1P9WTS7_9BACT|nr:PorP/SprF family type IX secretion system membrane protein [Spirosoma montaniterrae]AQG78781.1 hypothetical protein AWR27_05235 [Spirosoma montaniterrae]